MSDIRDPETDQVAPIPNDGPSTHDLVIADLQKRKDHGLRKYDSLLQPFNGRNQTLDAYEEILDLAVYLRNKLEEEKSLIRVRILHCGFSDEHSDHFYEPEKGGFTYCPGYLNQS